MRRQWLCALLAVSVCLALVTTYAEMALQGPKAEDILKGMTSARTSWTWAPSISWRLLLLDASASCRAPATRARWQTASLNEGNNPQAITHHIRQERRAGHPDNRVITTFVTRNVKETAVLQGPLRGEVRTGYTTDR